MGQVSLTLNGRTYRVGCEDGEEKRLGALGAHVREKLETVVRDFGQVGEARLLMMTALLIADELYETRAERDSAAGSASSAVREIADRTKSDAKAASIPPPLPSSSRLSEPPRAASSITTKTNLVPSKPAEGAATKPEDAAKADKPEEPQPALSSLQAAMNRQAPVASSPDPARRAG